MNTLKGMHHVTAITSSAEKIYEFYTNVLGLRLVKKTINQDDIHTYHLFFADDAGNPGTDITFFDFNGIPKARRGTNEISGTMFRVPNETALEYWIKRFDHFDVTHEPIQDYMNERVLFFEDFDGQRYALISDENDYGIAGGVPWKKGPVPNEYGIYGLGPSTISVFRKDLTDQVLVEILGMRKTHEEGPVSRYEMGIGGNGGSIFVTHNMKEAEATQGYGGVHHIAFRVENQEVLESWIQYFDDMGLSNSGFVDRFYFKSLYVRMLPGILFEIATDGPGFIDDEEPYEILGETIALPPKFRNQREHIEGLIRHFDTVRSNKEFKKEYYHE